MKRILAYLLLFFVLASLLTGCSTESEEVEALQKEVERLSHENDELRAQLETDDKTVEEVSDLESTASENQISDIVVEAIDMKISEGSFSKFVEIQLSVENHYEKEIRGIEGALEIKDMFGKHIMSLGWDIVEQPIEPGASYIQTGYGFDVNQFMDSHSKVVNTSFEDLIFTYAIKQILFTDGSSSQW